MNRLIVLVTGFLVSHLSHGQSSCDIDKLPKRDCALLQDFCKKFKEAINVKDKQRLSGLCNFPFTCSYCIVDSSKETNKPYINVTKKLFEASQYKIFFDKNLIETINSSNLLSVLLVENTEKKNECSYFFGYPIVKPSKTWEGQQGFFTIKKVNGQYQITSAWTVP